MFCISRCDGGRRLHSTQASVQYLYHMSWSVPIAWCPWTGKWNLVGDHSPSTLNSSFWLLPDKMTTLTEQLTRQNDHATLSIYVPTTSSIPPSSPCSTIDLHESHKMTSLLHPIASCHGTRVLTDHHNSCLLLTKECLDIRQYVNGICLLHAQKCFTLCVIRYGFVMRLSHACFPIIACYQYLSFQARDDRFRPWKIGRSQLYQSHLFPLAPIQGWHAELLTLCDVGCALSNALYSLTGSLCGALGSLSHGTGNLVDCVGHCVCSDVDVVWKVILYV